MTGHGGTPVSFKADDALQDAFLSLHLPRRDILLPLVDYKADFPPMMDSRDPVLDRDFSSHLARIDITHPHVLRASEPNFGGGGGGGGFATKGVLTSWPIPDDREIRITQDFFGTYIPYACDGSHRALDLTYSDGSHSSSTPILAAGPGRVSRADPWCCEECGPCIEITHQIPPLPSQNTFITRYLHLDRLTVSEGDVVVAGETIGYMGDRGAEPGAMHLHFAVWLGATCDSARNPCGELPAPANGTNPECVGATVAELICSLFGNAIAVAGDDPLVTDSDGLTLRRVDAALAIARFESTGSSCAFNEAAQNCITRGGGTLSPVGLFQVQNPTHIANDVGAGNISLASVITNDPNCPGIEVAQDYKVAYNNILSAIRISSRGANFGPWASWTERNPATGELYYRECLGRGCP